MMNENRSEMKDIGSAEKRGWLGEGETERGLKGTGTGTPGERRQFGGRDAFGKLIKKGGEGENRKGSDTHVCRLVRGVMIHCHYLEVMQMWERVCKGSEDGWG